ncbi:hypothetical protein SmJEL517_g03044 [Synchytrium microbalum]|uniref:PAN2-PAN3 deadenylation complex subunit PAN3 n=1 Tax=Synchytrium microbalum TaxID=1806994 RepID=A0A507C9N1_9FUNG|nr:uncharacterized protein SmJEL517_g03044 [Synchytrium microbalum]TPX34253.1 hypothetical protein SmJEL517_g03044 [Synchytrium microbalum]
MASAAAKSKIQCRNITIYGFCKKEGKGCEFNHETQAAKASASNTPAPKTNDMPRPKITASFTPPRPSVPLTLSQSVDVPEFDPLLSYNPYATTQPSMADNTPAYPASDLNVAGSGQALPPTSDPSYQQQQQGYEYYDPQTFVPDQQANGYPSNEMAQMNLGAPSGGQPDPNDTQANQYYGNQQEGGYYYEQPQVREPLQYHLYTTPLPHISNLHPHQKTIHSFFMSDHLREELHQRSEASQQVTDPARVDLSRMPSELHVYSNFLPLDDHLERSVKVFGYPTWVYRATNRSDGNPYVLRRIEGFRLLNELAMTAIDSWRRIRHANIVMVREAFTTRAFGDFSLVIVYDYHPLSITLAAKHFQQNSYHPSNSVPEKTLWSYIVQIASALKTIHAAGLAARVIEPSKVILTGKNRIRLNCCGIFDMLTYDGGKNMVHYQQDDLFHFGQLIVALACGSLASVNHLPKSMDHIARHYTPDMKNIVSYLLSKPTMAKSIDDVVLMIGPRILHEINSAHHYNDMLEGELGRELENGRLVRLMSKLSFINERPEFDLDPRWSETGDRYLLKLFRDYVFHQVDDNGRPLLDIGHVITCLNKLDVGIDEKVMLMSRDQQTILIVSYKELKQCLSGAMADLMKAK